MKKAIILLCLVFTVSICTFAQSGEHTFTIEITNVTINGGTIYLAIFANADEFRREEPRYVYELQSNSTSVTQSVTLPYGEYLISAFQDANNNQKLDSNFLGIPRELVGLSNYDGRGFPSRNFDRHKIPINNATTRISIALHRF